MKIYILKYFLFLFSIVYILSSCSGIVSSQKHLTSLDSVFMASGKGKKHLLFICLSAYDCVNCYKPVYDAIKTFQCSNVIYISTKIRQPEKEQFMNTIRSKTMEDSFSFFENSALLNEIYSKTGLLGPNTISVIDENKNVVFSANLKLLSEKSRRDLKGYYCE